MQTFFARRKIFFLIGVFCFLFFSSDKPLWPAYAQAQTESTTNSSCEAVQEGFGPFKFTGSIVPCGRSCDVAATTEVNEHEQCTLCHLLILVQNVFQLMLALLFTVAILFITIGGVLYVVSAGNPTLKSQAKGAITSTLKGFGLFFLSWLIVITIMKIIDVNSPVLNSTSPFTFTCDTTSHFTNTSGPVGPATMPDKKCCIKSQDTNDPNYGKAENCPASEGKSKMECEKWCEQGGGTKEYIDSCKAGCKDEQTCPEGSTMTENCSAQPACTSKNTGNNPAGQCNPTNNGCGGLAVDTRVGDGCNYTSSNLASKLACIKSKVPTAIVTSVTKNGVSDWCSACAWNYGGEGKCAHTKNSCHFGGKNCKGTSVAVDLTASDTVAQAALSCGFDTVIWQGRELRTGKAASDHTDHVHASVDNKACGCDYQK